MSRLVFITLALIALVVEILPSWPVHQAAAQQNAASNYARREGKPRERRNAGPRYEEFLGVEPVQEVLLRKYLWHEVEQSMEELLEAALGTEVTYWTRRGVTCDDVAHTVRALHSVFLHSVRVVVIRNQTWHFLNPAAPSATQPGTQQAGTTAGTTAGTAAAGERSSRFDWPPLVPNPYGTCSSPCQAQLRHIHETVGARVNAARAQAEAPPGGGRLYTLPDMVFVINAADNMQRFGVVSRSPVMSLLKWWRAPWGPQPPGGANATTTTGNGDAISLGRIGGALLRAGELPSNVAAAAAAAAIQSSSSSSSSGGSSNTHAGHADVGGKKGRQGSGASEEEDLDTRSAAGAGVEAASGVRTDVLWDMVRSLVQRPRNVPLRLATDAPPPPPPPRKLKVTPARVELDRLVRDYDMDLLMPTMAYAPRSLSSFPWDLKKDIAFFSGSSFCPLYTDLHPVCPRLLLANVSAAGWYPGDLDVRLMRPFRGRMGSRGVYREAVSLPAAPARTAPRDHSRYRYLLAVDGFSGSTRMGVLMSTDSVILKSRSPFIEYYSRLQVPGAHYLEFWKDPADPLDVLRTLAEARRAAAGDPEGLRAAVRANQAIVARYISQIPKLVYARAALLTYQAIIPDMQECVDDLVQLLERSETPLPQPPPS